MEITNINKYISYIENDNIIIYFYKKDLHCVIDKTKNILYIKDINKTSLIENIDISRYKTIVNTNLENIYNSITII